MRKGGQRGAQFFRVDLWALPCPVVFYAGGLTRSRGDYVFITCGRSCSGVSVLGVLLVGGFGLGRERL